MFGTGKPVVQRLLVAALVAVGLGTVWAIALGWTMSLAEQALSLRRTYQQLWIREDGTPLIATEGSSQPGEYSVRTLDGQEVPGGREIKRLQEISFSWLGQRAWYWSDLDWSQRLSAFNDGSRPPNYWYFVHDGRLHGRGYFVGFESRSKRKLGYIGAAGFRSDPPPPEDCFAVDGRLAEAHSAMLQMGWYAYAEPAYTGLSSTTVLVAADRLVQVNLHARTVRPLFDGNGAVLMGVHELSRSRKTAEGNLVLPPYYATRAADRIILVDSKTHAQRSCPLPPEAAGRWVGYYPFGPDGAAIVEVNVVDDWRAEKREHELFWLDEAGKVTRRQTVYLVNSRSVFDDRRIGVWGMLAFLPAPLPLTAVDPFLAAETTLGPKFAETPVFRSWLAGWPLAWPTLLAGAAVGAASAWRCYQRQVRYVQPHSAAWVVLVFLLGIPGYWGYRWHRRWPVLLRCPHCGVHAPRDRECCAHCQREFPPPPARQIEVFAA